MRRFDLDSDDNISMEECEMARELAKQQVGDEHRKTRLLPGTHLLKKPAKRLYLIANCAPVQLAARYRFWEWTHLGIAIGACITAASLL